MHTSVAGERCQSLFGVDDFLAESPLDDFVGVSVLDDDDVAESEVDEPVDVSAEVELVALDFDEPLRLSFL